MDLIALFNPSSNLVGWMSPGDHIFDTNMNWAAYIENGHTWSVNSDNWLGPIEENSCLDRNGNVVAWSTEGNIPGTVNPVKPVKPVRPVKPVSPVKPVDPVKPVKPVTPVGGWSNLSWEQWLSQ